MDTKALGLSTPRGPAFPVVSCGAAAAQLGSEATGSLR